MKKIIYTRSDGGLSVVTPVINTHTIVDGEVVAVPEDMTETQALERAMAKLPVGALDVRVVDESAIPTDRTYRNAWKAGANGVEHDMDKAREIHKERLRAQRAPLLAQLDTEYMRADEKGDAAGKARIAAEKQALRDVTKDPSIEQAATVEELKAAVPVALLRKE